MFCTPRGRVHASWWCIFLWLLPLVAATADRNVRRQYDDQSDTAVDCKEFSLTEPRWYIYDPRYSLHNFSTGGTLGDAGFEAYNLATNETFVCLVQNINLTLTGNDIQWYNCSIPNAQFMFDLTAQILGIRESWTCDNAPTLKFVGNGTTVIPMALGCGTDTDYFCLYGNTEIAAQLSSPININPYEPWLPRTPYLYPDQCGARSYYPTWEIDDLFYDHSTENQTLSFNLTNLGNGKKTACSINASESEMRETFHKTHWLDCNAESSSQPLVENGIAGTKVMFDKDYALVGVQQVWRCLDNDTSDSSDITPIVHNGTGYATLALDCTNNETYDGSTESSPAKYTCTLPATNVSGYRADDLPQMIPHTSYTHSCTINSMNNTWLMLQQYLVETDDNDNQARASFRIFNPGPGDEYGIEDIPVRTDGSWQDCGGDKHSLPWQLLSCRYQYDAAANKVGFQLQWNCDDRDPYHALIFTATASGDFPKSLCKTTTASAGSSVTTCSLPAGSTDGRLVISALNWTATGAPMVRGPSLPWV